eukprot:CAMPEP_0168628752 /NCGR_PEP_ID=MMETSP0449_2-20121227/12020_1 /TAXON_ID=1082188 /ORGANISM="Strombidium rassoulzadegani, Strain ras09" /LENGTH=152 /DNA_ID=CAMNT_0008671209 /DNA_START=180 /DNA_END=638 /DNA_ORIENTATION=-
MSCVVIVNIALALHLLCLPDLPGIGQLVLGDALLVNEDLADVSRHVHFEELLLVRGELEEKIPDALDEVLSSVLVEELGHHLDYDGLDVLVLDHEVAALLETRQIGHDVGHEVEALVLAEVARHSEDGLRNNELRLLVPLQPQQMLLTDIQG